MAQILRSVQIMTSHEPALNDVKGSRARKCTCIKLAQSSQANISGRVGVVVATPAARVGSEILSASIFHFCQSSGKPDNHILCLPFLLGHLSLVMSRS